MEDSAFDDLNRVNWNNHSIGEAIDILKSRGDPMVRQLVVWLIRCKHFDDAVYNVRLSIANCEREIGNAIANF